jgi:hypothetical protein
MGFGGARKTEKSEGVYEVHTKNLYKKTNEKKKGSIIQGIGVWWCQKNIKI